MLPSLLRPALAGAAIAVLFAASDPACAAGQRSFVSTKGVDNPTCALTSPCRSFGAAVTATAPGGEVIVLDSGGYGPVTIEQSVSIVSPPGIYAGISAMSGNGVTVTTAAPFDRVVLQGLTITSQGGTGHGIAFTGTGELEVTRARISGFVGGAGLMFWPAAGGQGRLRAVGVTTIGNGTGVFVVGGTSASDTAYAKLERVDSSANGTGLQGYDFASIVATESAFTYNSPYGILLDPVGGTFLLATIDRCDVSHNAAGAVTVGAGSSYLTFTGATIAHNQVYGLRAISGSEVRLAGTTIAQNAIGIYFDGGSVQSQGNNFIYGNGSDGVVPTVVGSK